MSCVIVKNFIKTHMYYILTLNYVRVMISPATALIKNVRRMEEKMARSLKAHTENCFQQAEAGEYVAQLQLGLMYSTGQKGALLDYVAAQKWLNLAALRGNDEANPSKKRYRCAR